MLRQGTQQRRLSREPLKIAELSGDRERSAQYGAREGRSGLYRELRQWRCRANRADNGLAAEPADGPTYASRARDSVYIREKPNDARSFQWPEQDAAPAIGPSGRTASLLFRSSSRRKKKKTAAEEWKRNNTHLTSEDEKHRAHIGGAQIKARNKPRG
ncbi:hypothetical protein MRX96_003822 [Rhipicephalus microplus]